MIKLLRYFVDRFYGKALQGQRRSSDWPRVRKVHLAEHPLCECCGGKKGIEVHHVLPFNLFPELELRKENLMSLCKKRGCHFAMHLYSWKSYNPDAKQDTMLWNEKVENRP